MCPPGSVTSPRQGAGHGGNVTDKRLAATKADRAGVVELPHPEGEADDDHPLISRDHLIMRPPLRFMPDGLHAIVLRFIKDIADLRQGPRGVSASLRFRGSGARSRCLVAASASLRQAIAR